MSDLQTRMTQIVERLNDIERVIGYALVTNKIQMPIPVGPAEAVFDAAARIVERVNKRGIK